MKKLILIIAACLSYCCSFGQITAFDGAVTGGYNLWLYQPPARVIDTVTGTPLIIFLHGSSLCGTDLNRVRRYGTLDAVEKGMNIEAYILAPQNPGGAWKPEKIKTVLDWAQSHYPIDSTRIYVVGMSLGGYGTLDFAGSYPERVAAAVALCGGSTLKSFDKLTSVPLWIIHGTADRAVSVNESRRVANAMRASGDTTLLRYEEIEGANHGALARVFYLPELYDWLFSYNAVELEPTINTEKIIIASNTLKNAYRSISKNAVKPQLIDNRQPTTTASSASATTDEGSRSVHTIKSGDTLGAIAKRYGTTVAKLCSRNNITAKTTLRIGQKLTI